MASQKVMDIINKSLDEHYSPFTVSILGKGLIALVLVAIPVSIWIQVYSESVVDNLKNTIEIIGLAEKRLEFYVETSRRAKLGEIIANGYIPRYTRHASINIPDYVSYVKTRIRDESTNLTKYNNLLRQEIYSLD